MENYVFKYKPIPPYSFSKHLEKFSLRNEPTPWIYDFEERTCRKLMVAYGEYVPVETLFKGEPWNPEITVTVWSKGRVEAEKLFRKVLETVRAYFNYNEFLDSLSKWPKLRKVAEKYAGLRPGRSMSIYEALIDSVVKQRIALKVALKIQAKLVRNYGKHYSIGSKHFYSHPTPESLAKASVDDIRSKGLTKVKAKALHEIAKAEVEGRLPSVREALKDPWSTAEELTRIYGVGKWTAELAIAMVHEKFPIGPRHDLAVKRGLKLIFGLSESEVEKLLNEIGDFAGLLMYLAAYSYEEAKR